MPKRYRNRYSDDPKLSFLLVLVILVILGVLGWAGYGPWK